MPVRIVIDARYVNDHFPGIGRYVYNLLDALGQLAAEHSFVALYNPDLPNTRHAMAALARHPNLQVMYIHLRPFSLGEQLALPRMLRRLQAGLFHAPYYLRPYLPLPCRSVTTLYDAIPRLFPAEVSPRARLLFNLFTRRAVRASSQILAISASARADLIAAYRIPSARISVAPLAADPRFAPQTPATIAAVRARHNLPARYLLCVGSNKPHKNLPALVEAFAQLLHTPDQQAELRDLQLVIAGHWDARYPAARQAAERAGLGQRVRFLPGVAEADLPGLYAGAELFVFPSRYEGFGLPPLEAMACGAPVLCSHSSSLPEVVGGAALLAEPTAGALAAGMARVLGDSRLRGRLSAAGPARAAQFSWRATAEATVAAYERAATHAA